MVLQVQQHISVAYAMIETQTVRTCSPEHAEAEDVQNGEGDQRVPAGAVARSERDVCFELRWGRNHDVSDDTSLRE